MKDSCITINATSQVRSKDIDDFMIDYAERAMKYKNIEIKSTDMESFIEDLIKIGELERVD